MVGVPKKVIVGVFDKADGVRRLLSIAVDQNRYGLDELSGAADSGSQHYAAPPEARNPQ